MRISWREAWATLLVLTPVVAIPTPSVAQDWAKAQISSIPVAANVHMLTVSGGNVAGGNIAVLVGDGGVLLVDSLFGELHDKITSAIAAIGGGQVRYLLNTNWHYDHALGNELFRKSGAVIIAHENCPARMIREQIHEVINTRRPPNSPAALPEVTFAESLALHLNGEDIVAQHVPDAHSDADAFYVFRRANVVHMGDLFFSGGYPYIDIGNGGTIAGMIAAADRVLAVTDSETRLIPGHGALADRKRLQAYRSMLVTVRDRVSALRNEGKTLEQVLAAKPTADLDAAWGQAMSATQFVTLVYKDLSRRQNDPVPPASRNPKHKAVRRFRCAAQGAHWNRG